jgi:predicted DNA-binding transcriptional regulator AlpA
LSNKSNKLLRYDDLVSLKIVKNRMTLQRWIEHEGFPPGILLGPNTRAWREEEVEAWLDSRQVKKEGGADVQCRSRELQQSTNLAKVGSR